MSSLRDFTRLKQVGRGAFGVAWLVEARSGGRRFVLKELGHKEMTERERLDARKEVMFLSKMNHANIVSYYNSFEEGGRVHILMEYCENGDLGARIKAQNGVLFKEDQILDYFVQICHGIKHIHDNKILHRDIKPQNIFLTKTNVVKLGDFGIAKLMNSTTAFTNTTVGTPFYFSPELCSRRMYNNKSDIWSLGCVLYELCTLNHAFSAQEMAILALRIKNVSYKPISINYSPPLRLLISSIFQRDPRERPNINEILKKSFISRVSDKNCPQNTPKLATPSKEGTPRLGTPVARGRVDSGLNNKCKVINRENLLANSPYLPPAKKPMVKRQDPSNKALIIKKNEIAKRGRAAMIINDRDYAWKNALSNSDDSKNGNPQEVAGADPKEKVEAKGPGMYEHYYEDLDKIKQQQELREAEAKQLMHRFHKICDDDIPEGVYRKIDPIKNNLQLGIMAADRDKLVHDYWENKQRALQNRNKNGAGVALALCGARKMMGNENRDHRYVPAATPLNAEEEMADRLNKIRHQNAEEKRNQNIGDFNLNFDKDKGVIINKENARLALEDLQKKIKLRSEELHQKLALKRLEKENDAESHRKEDQAANPPNDAQNRLNNVILFPKRADPAAPFPRVHIEENKIQNPRMTNILDQLKDHKPTEEIEGQNMAKVPHKRVDETEVDLDLDKLPDPQMTNILNDIKNMKPSGDEIKSAWIDNKDMKMASMSVVLNQLREDHVTPRPTTAPPAEKLEIKKIKTDILKRLNKNQILLDKVDENVHRRSWALEFDDNLIKKEDNSQDLDQTLTEKEEEKKDSPRTKWQTDLNQPSDFARDQKPPSPSPSNPVPKSIWSHNKDFPPKMMVKEGGYTLGDELTLSPGTMAQDSPNLPGTPDNVGIISTDSEHRSENRDNDDLLSTILEESRKNESEPQENLVTKTDAWEKETKDSKDIGVPLEDKTGVENRSRTSSSCSSQDDDKEEVSIYMRKLLEIKMGSSEEDQEPENQSTKYRREEEEEDPPEYLAQITEARSMPNLLDMKDVNLKKTKSEGDLTKDVDDEDFSESDHGDDGEDFSDEKIVDENIYLKIEMIRHKLENMIGLDPLIDAIDFVNESPDLDGDDITARLREMLNGNEDAVNDVFHLVVLEKQYSNKDDDDLDDE